MLRLFLSFFLSITIHFLVLCITITHVVSITNNQTSSSCEGLQKQDQNDNMLTININSFKENTSNNLIKYVYKRNKTESIRTKKNNYEDNGISINLKGWTLMNLPIVDDSSQEIGFIKFNITVDDFGSVTSVKTIEKNISNHLETLYKKATYDLKFEKNENTTCREGTIYYSIMYS